MTSQPFNLPKLPDYYTDNLIKTALAEDINYIDVTTDLLFDNGVQGEAALIAKADGVLSGIETATRVFSVLDNGISFNIRINDSQPLKIGDVIADITGNIASILKAERTALNILQHTSGIATYTRKCVDAIAGTNAVIADTRKTLPGLRPLQKYAVLCGGGTNHRFNLSSAAMLKDNHIDAAGSITKAVALLRERAGHLVKTEVEVRDLEQLWEALNAGVDVIMLDNMDIETMKQAVEIKGHGKTLLEASGNVTLDNIREIAGTGVDIISIGALTHSVTALDISLKYKI